MSLGGHCSHERCRYIGARKCLWLWWQPTRGELHPWYRHGSATFLCRNPHYFLIYEGPQPLIWQPARFVHAWFCSPGFTLSSLAAPIPGLVNTGSRGNQANGHGVQTLGHKSLISMIVFVYVSSYLCSTVLSLSWSSCDIQCIDVESRFFYTI